MSRDRNYTHQKDAEYDANMLSKNNKILQLN